ncbi:MAG: hypothetical protein Q7K40_03145 [bacterium]|nr:hypothetical protein [bacterium]
MGILLILLGTVGMIFLFTKIYFTPTTQNGTAPSATQYERLRSDIGVANDIANEQKLKAEEQTRLLNNI